MCSLASNSRVSDSGENIAGTSRLSNSQNSMQAPKWRLMLFAAFITLCTTAAGAVGSISDIDVPKKCNSDLQGHETLQIDDGWPFEIDCRKLLENEMSFLFMEPPAITNTTEFQCIVSSEGVILHSANFSFSGEEYYSTGLDVLYNPYRVSEALANQTGTNFTSHLISGGRCTSMSHTLIVMNDLSKDATCANTSPEQAENAEAQEGNLFVVTCFASRNTFQLKDETYQVTWYKDCNELKSTEKNGYEGLGDKAMVDQLLLYDANFTSTPGEYTCSVSYKGHRRFMSRTSLCVRYSTPQSPSAFTQISQKKTRAHKGDDVTLTCGGATGGETFSFAVVWLKNSSNGTTEHLCTNAFMSELPSGDAKYQCIGFSNRIEASKCHNNYEDAMLDRNRGIITANSTLTIKNFQDSDAGEYICRVISTREPEELTFVVLHQQAGNLTTILAVILGALFFLVVTAALVVLIRRGYLQKQWKKAAEKSTAGLRHEKNLPQSVV